MDSIVKAEIKKGILNELGIDADDKLESMHRQKHEHAGGKRALAQASKSVQSIAAAIQADLDAEKLDDMEALAVAEYAKRQVARCAESLTNAARHMESLELSAMGAIQAYTAMVDHLKKRADLEQSLIARYREAIASGEITIDENGDMISQSQSRLPGSRPGPSIAQARKQEAVIIDDSDDETDDDSDEVNDDA